jgi:hypothetical protein
LKDEVVKRRPQDFCKRGHIHCSRSPSTRGYNRSPIENAIERSNRGPITSSSNRRSNQSGKIRRRRRANRRSRRGICKQGLSLCVYRPK